MAEIIQYLKKPIEYEGKKYEFLALDFEALTGKDVREAKRAFDRPDRIVPVLAMDTEFGAFFAARAAKVPYELMDYLSAPDYLAVAQAGINFLLVSGFSEADQADMKAQQKKIETQKLADSASS
ncbi:phage tail assembly protein [Turicimonas muris]|uniref:phage tail assembly protein n=1 Tax=Turicimonas muris TaxID=1796652 RepID=UPI00248C12D2|nr:phage tail assembly protein [Turicimonas muris]